jgi:hypothetical protein
VATTSAQFREPGCDHEVDLCLQVVKLQLHSPEPGPNVTCDLLAKVPDADGATCQHPNECCYEQDHLNHRLSAASGIIC